jgi:hypothetical protein
VSQQLNPAWMREWPESFLTPQTLATGALAGTAGARPPALRGSGRQAGATAVPAAYLTFDNLQIAIRSRNADQLHRVGPTFGARPGDLPGNVIAELELASTAGTHVVLQNGQPVGQTDDEAQLGDLVKRLVVPVLARARQRHAWLRGAAFARAGRALVIAGSLGNGDDSLVEAMRSADWDLLEEAVVAIRIQDQIVLPFGGSERPEGAVGHRRPMPTPLVSLVVATQQLYGRNALAPLSPAVAVAELIITSLDFPVDRDRAVDRLCRLVEHRPVAKLQFSRPEAAARLLSGWADPTQPTVAP